MLCLALPACHKVQKLDFQSEFSMSKIIRIFLIFFSLRNKILVAHFLVTSILKLFQMVKSCLIFDQAAKVDKVFRDAHNPGLWLILQDLLKNWVAEGVASDVNEFNEYGCRV